MIQYPVFSIGPGMWEINEFDGASMFLVEGTERALLIDTGIGIGNLKSFVESLTAKPYDVFLTHNHRDHVGNAPQFPRVYMSRQDISTGPMLRPRTSLESRIAYETGIRKRYSDRIYPWTEADFTVFSPEDEPEVLPAEDGQVFDLGNRTLTACLVPGHSPGSMALIDSLTHTLFAGDCVNCNIGMGISPAGSNDRAMTVAEGLAALKKLWEKDFDRKLVFNGHPDFRKAGTPLAENVFPTAIAALEEILDGAFSETVYQETLSRYVDVYYRDPVMIRFDRNNLK